jgi:SAM-dependent methyltransferase
MLDIARAKSGGTAVTWVEGDARSLRLGRRFDLITLTGHAFQVFLTAADRAAVAATIATHLAPGGLFIFDSRNPARREWEGWRPDLTREWRDLPGLGRVESWNDVDWDDARQVATYRTCYRAGYCAGRRYTAQSRIASPRRARSPQPWPTRARTSCAGWATGPVAP